MYKIIEKGSVTSPKGFQASGIVAGLKRSGKPDMALIVSEAPAKVSGAFTANKFAAAPVQYDREIVDAREPVRAIIVNSGNANACTGAPGRRDAEAMAAAVAARLQLAPAEVLVSSTGRIGVPMPMGIILAGIEKACGALSRDGGLTASEAIITTDTYAKPYAVSVEIGGRTVTIGGCAKGAGMIAPKLVGPKCEATMLAYLTTDAAVSQDFLDWCLAQSLDQSFNRVTVDGDTSTNDTFLVLANGLAGNPELKKGTPEAAAFAEAFNAVAGHLARELVLDGEGVTRFVELTVTGAKSDADARRAAEAIANSALCKTAWFGADPNWGRVLCAAGYSGIDFNPDQVNLDYEGIPVVRGGRDAGTPESTLSKAINVRKFRIDLDLGSGPGRFTIWTCDLTYEYVKINADYHT
jgi:glutamate N-acetyltransferase/amino-acid N-acetyltransferase